jgi:phosphoribosyl 1,2-cyclic phosphodiesterase
MPLTLTLWGVRGSIPAPGEQTVRYGGNTPCVSVQWGDKRCLVLDAGTGIRLLGDSLLTSRSEIHVILSHSHWDHIQGFPFFAPIYDRDRVVHMYPSPVDKGTLCSLIEQMDGAHFPIRAEDLMGINDCILTDPIDHLAGQGIRLSQIALNHPGGACGYRVDDSERRIVYMSDNELAPPSEPATQWEQFVAFCLGADVLIHDAQYLPDDMPKKHGWGHSVVDQVLRLAAEAEVKRLVLFHHDPERSDDQLDAIEAQAQDWCRDNAPSTECHVGAEGMTIAL